MRILSWNINGIRTLPHYHLWSALKACDAILPELHADIICFQEMKVSRRDLDRKTAVPEGYDSFFSFPQQKSGYSGVAIYCNPRSAIAAKAEEGLSLHLQPRPPFTPSERISDSYPSAHELPLLEDEHGCTPDLVSLDTEGRALVLDFGLFVLVNVYCPNDASDERLAFKVNYGLMLENRVKTLIKEGRQVIVVGDINVAATPLDHCDGGLESKRKEWYSNPSRDWFRKWLVPLGPMHDIIREAWPDRKGMYTCWNMKIQARDTNYGTRIDYVLMTSNLLPWVKGADILANVRGSDHCPIYVDLHDEITLPSGKVLVLRKELGALIDDPLTPPKVTSRLAARFWDEWSGKQTLLSNFFKKGNDMPQAPPRGCESSALTDNIVPSAQGESEPMEVADSTETAPDYPIIANVAQVDTSLTDAACSSITQKSPHPSIDASATKKRRPSSPSDSTPKLKSKKSRSGQATLSSFFKPPALLGQTTSEWHRDSAKSKRSNVDTGLGSGSESQVGNSQSTHYVILDDESSSQKDSTTSPNVPHSRSAGSKSPLPEGVEDPSYIESDYAYALLLSVSSDKASSSARSNSAVAWRRMMAPIETPRCTVHNEPTRLLTVNKPGPNKDKEFFTCSRPVGPGYDSGRSRRLREEVNSQYRCDFFKWASDVRREQRPRGEQSEAPVQCANSLLP